MSTCGALFPSPGSDYAEDECGLPAGHDGPHRFTHEDQYRSYTITWEDKPQPAPTPEELARLADFRARYVTSVPDGVGLQVLLSKAVEDRIKDGKLRWQPLSYRTLKAKDVTE